MAGVAGAKAEKNWGLARPGLFLADPIAAHVGMELAGGCRTREELEDALLADWPATLERPSNRQMGLCIDLMTLLGLLREDKPEGQQRRLELTAMGREVLDAAAAMVKKGNRISIELGLQPTHRVFQRLKARG